MNIKEYIKRIPKIELHCHLDGSIPKATMEDLLGKKLTNADISVDMECQSLAEYLEKFNIPLQALTTKEALKQAGKDFLHNLTSDNVAYVEVRFAPLLHVHEHLSLQDVMESVLSGLLEGEKETGISFGLIACAMRHHAIEDSLLMFQEIRDYYKHGLVGVDLAGDEAAFSNRRFVDLFIQAKNLGYRYTIHAGEVNNVDEIQFALDAEANRVGHGIALGGHKEMMKRCRKKGLGIEMCPISNMHTKAVSNWSEYPLREFLAEGLLCTVNTDNRTVSNTSLQKEFEFLVDRFQLEKEEVDTLIKNAIMISFADDSKKEELLQIWKGKNV